MTEFAKLFVILGIPTIFLVVTMLCVKRGPDWGNGA